MNYLLDFAPFKVYIYTLNKIIHTRVYKRDTKK